MVGTTKERGKERAHVAVRTDTVTFLDSIASTGNLRGLVKNSNRSQPGCGPAPTGGTSSPGAS
jgi:hypothetical protein